MPDKNIEVCLHLWTLKNTTSQKSDSFKYELYRSLIGNVAEINQKKYCVLTVFQHRRREKLIYPYILSPFSVWYRWECAQILEGECMCAERSQPLHCMNDRWSTCGFLGFFLNLLNLLSATWLTGSFKTAGNQMWHNYKRNGFPWSDLMSLSL